VARDLRYEITGRELPHAFEKVGRDEGKGGSSNSHSEIAAGYSGYKRAERGARGAASA
jgi:hypothetical protein